MRVLASRDSTILTDEALEFLAELTRNHRPRLEELLARREAVQARYDAGEKPRFLPETAHVREGTWKARPWPRKPQRSPGTIFVAQEQPADPRCSLSWFGLRCGYALCSQAERFTKRRWLRCQRTCWTGGWRSPGQLTGRWLSMRCASLCVPVVGCSCQCAAQSAALCIDLMCACGAQLNSGSSVFMADFEDSNAPTWCAH